MIGWIADHLDPIGCYMACLLGSILAAWGGLGPHFGGLRDILAMAWLPGWPGDPRMGWIALRPRRKLFYWDLGIQVPGNVEGDLVFFRPTIN